MITGIEEQCCDKTGWGVIAYPVFYCMKRMHFLIGNENVGQNNYTCIRVLGSLIMKKIASIIMVMLMVFTFMPWSAFAEDSTSATEEAELETSRTDDEVISSGICGTCKWVIDANGTITFTFTPECKYYTGSMTLTYKITKVPKVIE